MKPYQPSLAAPFGGLILLILVVLLGGIVVGGLVSLIASLIYLIILFPVVMGLIGGALVNFAVRLGKIRNPGLALGAALLMGVVMVGAMWATQYFQSQNAQVTGSGQSGFMGYLSSEAQQGAVVWRFPVAANQPVHLGTGLSWGYWGFEILLVVGLAALTGRKQAVQPFCEACGRWYPEPESMGTLGAKRAKELLGWIEDGQFIKLGEELQGNPALPNVGFFMATCGEDCKDGEAYVEVRAQKRGSRGNVRAENLSSGLISATQTQDLLTGIENRKALYGI